MLTLNCLTQDFFHSFLEKNPQLSSGMLFCNHGHNQKKKFVLADNLSVSYIVIHVA